MTRKKDTADRHDRHDRYGSPRPNRIYKATLFAMLFGEKKNLLELYNAVNGSDYDDPDLLEINTLENAIYISMKNDVSFVIDSRLSLYEHQSTYNPNLPLRFLFYVADLLASMTAEENLFGSRLIELPTPNFLIFYNGTMEQPDRMELRLSDAFKVAVDEPALELTAIMYNINIGHNQKLMESCRTLREYAEYTARIRKYAGQMRIGQAVEQAITECINEGILSEFLRKNRAEAMNLSIYEIDEERMKELFRQDGYENGYESGYEQGRDAGEITGKIAGEIAGQKKCILKLLKLKGDVPDDLAEQIRGESDSEKLDEYFDLAVRAESVEDFLAGFQNMKSL